MKERKQSQVATFGAQALLPKLAGLSRLRFTVALTHGRNSSSHGYAQNKHLMKDSHGNDRTHNGKNPRHRLNQMTC